MQRWITALVIVLLLSGPTGAEQQEAPNEYGTLTGQVVMDGKPMLQATISIFNAGSGPPPDRGSSRRVPEGMFRAEAGRFRIVLAPGRYYMGVVSRLDPDRKGPPGEDEKFFFVRGKKGELRQFEAIAGKTIDLGVISGLAPEAFPEIANGFTVEGTIYDERGKPFKGALVLVRGNLAVPRPLFISPPTGRDGKYRLKLPAGQSFYLVVRDNLVDVGRPVIGSPVGVYVRDSASAAPGAPMLSGGDPITGRAGQVLKGMDITIRKVANPEEVKESLQKQAESPLPLGKAGKMPLPAPGAR